MASTPARTRAIATSGLPTGALRFRLYKQAYSRINEAMQDGYNLEAITIVESLVSDRLESRLSALLGKDFSFQTLGAVVNKVKSVETDAALGALVDVDLRAWAKQRNSALHEMAKMADGDSSTWDARMNGLANCCEWPFVAQEDRRTMQSTASRRSVNHRAP